MGQQPSYYLRYFERLLCDLKQLLDRVSGERLKTARTGRSVLRPALGAWRFVGARTYEYGRHYSCKDRNQKLTAKWLLIQQSYDCQDGEPCCNDCDYGPRKPSDPRIELLHLLFRLFAHTNLVAVRYGSAAAILAQTR